MTKCHIPEDLNPQQWRKNLRAHNPVLVQTTISLFPSTTDFIFRIRLQPYTLAERTSILRYWGHPETSFICWPHFSLQLFYITIQQIPYPLIQSSKESVHINVGHPLSLICILISYIYRDFQVFSFTQFSWQNLLCPCDKCFELVDLYQMGTEEHITVGRKREVLCAIITSVHKTLSVASLQVQIL